jgi:hypothetical protein
MGPRPVVLALRALETSAIIPHRPGALACAYRKFIAE